MRTCLYLQALGSQGPVWVKLSQGILGLTLIHCCLFFSWNHFFTGHGRDLICKDQGKERFGYFNRLHSLPLNPLLHSAESTFSLFRFSLLIEELKLFSALRVPSEIHLSLSLVFPNIILTLYGNASKVSFVVCHCFCLPYIMLKNEKCIICWI